MAVKEKKKKKYRLVVFEEVSLNERFNLTLTKTNLFIYISVIFITISIIVGLLFIFTPLKYFLPPIDNYNLQNEIFKNSISIDSLKKEISLRDNYFMQVSNIIKGIDIEELGYIDTNNNLLSQQEKDSIVDNLIERDKQSLAEIREGDNIAVNNLNFKKPVENYTISDFFDATKKHFGVDLTVSEDEPVLTILDGTVVFTDFSEDNGFVIQIQHTNNIISIYKYNSKLEKQVGDRVLSGEQIATVGTIGNSSDFILHFEIWQDGVPIDPTNYIKL